MHAQSYKMCSLSNNKGEDEGKEIETENRKQHNIWCSILSSLVNTEAVHWIYCYNKHRYRKS